MQQEDKMNKYSAPLRAGTHSTLLLLDFFSVWQVRAHPASSVERATYSWSIIHLLAFAIAVTVISITQTGGR